MPRAARSARPRRRATPRWAPRRSARSAASGRRGEQHQDGGRGRPRTGTGSHGGRAGRAVRAATSMNGSRNAARLRYEPMMMTIRRTESSSRSCSAAAPDVTTSTTAIAIARPMPLKMMSQSGRRNPFAKSRSFSRSSCATTPCPPPLSLRPPVRRIGLRAIALQDLVEGAAASIRPSAMIATWSQMRWIRCMLWLDISTVPPAAVNFFRMSMTSWARHRVDRLERLVEHQQAGRVDHRRRDRDLLHHAGRVVGDEAVQRVLEAERVDQVGGAVQRRLTVEAAEAGRVVQVLGAGEAVEEAQAVGQHAEHALRHRGVAPDVGSVDLDDPGVRAEQAGDHRQRRGLSCAVGADESVERARAHLEVGRVDRHRAAEPLGEVGTDSATSGRTPAGVRAARDPRGAQRRRCRSASQQAALPRRASSGAAWTGASSSRRRLDRFAPVGPGSFGRRAALRRAFRRRPSAVVVGRPGRRWPARGCGWPTRCRPPPRGLGSASCVDGSG